MDRQPRTEAELCFYIPTRGEKPFRNRFETAPGVYKTNIETEAKRVAIFDARTLAAPPRLDIDGYELVAHETDVDFSDEGAIRSKLVLEKQMRLLPHRVTQVFVERGVGGRIRRRVLQLAKLEPLAGEVLDQRL